MANINTQSFTALVTNFATAVQGTAATLVDFTIGSVLRAIDEAVAYIALWLQGLILQVAALTRAATSNETDLDSWFAQFGFSRLAAVAATGQETFARYTPTNQAVIPVGAIVQSADGTVQFAVIADTTNAAYSATLGGYVLPAAQSSVSVTIQCTTAGVLGNVSSGALSNLGTSISGVDYVTNASAFSNGVAAELDAAARARFVLYIASLEAATLQAIYNAIASVQQGLTYTVAENKQYNGSTKNGYFTVIVNDGSGSPPSQLLTNVGTAIDAARPLCSTFGVHGPTVETANIVMVLTTATGYTHSSVVTLVITALQTYITGLALGQSLPYSMLSAIAYGASPGVTNVTGVLLNSGTSDLTATAQQTIVAGTMGVT